ncbi:MAG: winged helix-turn-helix domain-containing protein, partial [Gammaproteobacteria bacterium]
ADDYIGKPFSVRELVLRVESVLKRTLKRSDYPEVMSVAGIRIDTANLVQVDVEHPIRFTRREIEILDYLNQHGQRPVPREELLEKVWGYRQPEAIETRTVDIHIAKIRRKIESDPKRPQFLVTVRGEGYRLLDHGV